MLIFEFVIQELENWGIQALSIHVGTDSLRSRRNYLTFFVPLTSAVFVGLSVRVFCTRKSVSVLGKDCHTIFLSIIILCWKQSPLYLCIMIFLNLTWCHWKTTRMPSPSFSPPIPPLKNWLLGLENKRSKSGKNFLSL